MFSLSQPGSPHIPGLVMAEGTMLLLAHSMGHVKISFCKDRLLKVNPDSHAAPCVWVAIKDSRDVPGTGGHRGGKKGPPCWSPGMHNGGLTAALA